jgi:hypothetical protein
LEGGFYMEINTRRALALGALLVLAACAMPFLVLS